MCARDLFLLPSKPLHSCRDLFLLPSKPLHSSCLFCSLTHFSASVWRPLFRRHNRPSHRPRKDQVSHSFFLMSFFLFFGKGNSAVSFYCLFTPPRFSLSPYLDFFLVHRNSDGVLWIRLDRILIGSAVREGLVELVCIYFVIKINSVNAYERA